MNNRNLIAGLVVLSTMLFINSCSNLGTNPGNQVIGNFLSITPSDNSQEVGLNQSISIQFAAPVDKKVIESNFVLISQNDISDSTCPVSKNMGHTDMNKAMMDSSMMNHLQKSHCTKGTFKWNNAGTKCEFKSDSTLQPNTEYMMYIDSDMMNHMRTVMSGNGMMNGSMGMMNCDCGGNNKLNDKTIITHFKTGNK